MATLPKKPKIKTKYKLLMLLDVFVIGVVVVDLTWLVFDAFFAVDVFRNLVFGEIPGDYKQHSIHKAFQKFDALVVTFLITEFLLRWFVAIVDKRHAKWFFFPLVNWYDLLGCIPSSSLRIFRLFRIGALVYKLHKWAVIDVNNYKVFNLLMSYYNIIVEEIADRVMVKVLNEAKNEIQRGKPITDDIVENVIHPKIPDIAHWIGHNIQRGMDVRYPEYREELKQYLQETVNNAMIDNQEVDILGKIPVMGDFVQTTLNSAVRDIVFGVIDRLLMDLTDPKRRYVLEQLVIVIMEVVLDHKMLERNHIPLQIINQSIELIIKRVKEKKWHQAEHHNPNKINGQN